MTNQWKITPRNRKLNQRKFEIFLKAYMTTNTCLITVLIAATMSNLTFAQSSPTIDRIYQTGAINLGYRDSAVPFSYTDQVSRPMGYSVDLCSKIIDSLKVQLKLPTLTANWVLVQASDRIEYVRSNKIDIECGNTTATIERGKLVNFTAPIFVTGAAVMVRTTSKFNTLSDLKDRKVAHVSGSTGEKIVGRANATGMGLLPLPLKSNADAFKALVSGQADAWITDAVLLSAFRATHVNPKDLRLLDRRHTTEPLALVYRKGDPEFDRLISRTLAVLINSGEVQRSYDKWFMSPIPPSGGNLEVPAGRLLRESWKVPTKVQADTDVITF
jgi:ABC-type amino acid transport substrate-binding protein